MTVNNPKIFPIGDSALTISFGNVISPELNKKVIWLADLIDKKRFEGLIEAVPAYSSVTLFYQVGKVRRHLPQFSTAFAAVKEFVEKILRELPENFPENNRLIEIPVSFNPKDTLDLGFVANENGLSEQDVVRIFLSVTYRVYLLGFLPGFAYMGEVDERIAVPRKDSPRKTIPPGSIGIAGRQTGIYSIESPGGWQIIGKTDFRLFTPEKADPVFLRSGDLVRFYPFESR